MIRIFDHLALAALLSSFFLCSCSRLGETHSAGMGKLTLSFVKGGELFTKSYPDLPDTSDFLLTVSDASGLVLYDGKYGGCPESVDVKAGNYQVKIMSSRSLKPAFDAPLFGDEQCVVVPAGGVGNVRLMCRQLNAGVSLDISPAFLVQCPDAVLFLKSSEGKLMYSYAEKRTAYFLPGPVSLMMSSGGKDQVLMVRELHEREMLSIRVSVPVSDTGGGKGMSVSIDTSRVWLQDDCIVGMGNSGAGLDDALGVAEARESQGADDVWVCGYVVGGDLTSSSASFDPPFESRTNILLGPRSSTADRKVCLSVQLPAGEVRDALNLVDNPSLLGRRICVRGDVVSAYYGIPGVKNTTEYQFL